MNRRLFSPPKIELRNIRARRQTLWRIPHAVVFLLLLSILLSPYRIRADEMPDLSMNGQSSISITLRDKNTDAAIPGGMLELIQIASVEVDNGFVFVPTQQFAVEDFTFDLSEKANLSDPALAGDINTYVENHSASVTQRTSAAIGTEGEGTGKALFSGLDLGLYLIRQTEAPKDYAKIGPFLVTIPQKTDAGYIYQVDATPKAGTVNELNPTTVICPTIKKTVTVAGNPSATAPNDGKFTFEFKRFEKTFPMVVNTSGAVSEGGAIVSQDEDTIVLSITGSGELAIGSITFEKAGEYFYQLSEQRGQDYHYSYDTRVYWIKYTVEVNAAGDGLEVVQTDVRLGGPTGTRLTEIGTLPFENPYTPDPTPTDTPTPTPTETPTPTPEPTVTPTPEPTPTEELSPTPTPEDTPTPTPEPTETPTPTPEPTETPTPTPEPPDETPTPTPYGWRPDLPDGYYYGLSPTPTPEEEYEEYEDSETPTPVPPGGSYTPPGGGSYTPPSGGGRLPQTGQLWWPMWLLCAAGAVLLTSGLIVSKRSSGKKK